MPQPDSRLLPFPTAASAAAVPPKRERDARIDLFRGLALAMILIDHMPVNPYEHITLRNFGFSDAAEAFFLMSGIAAGIAYSPKLKQWMAGERGFVDAAAPLWKRAWTLYRVQILMTLWVLAMYAVAADVFYRAEFREVHNLGLIFTETGTALMGIVTLGYQIGYVNILPAYIVLMLVTPLILLGVIRAPWLTLGLSLVVWFVAGALRLNIPNHPGGGGWFFSPLTWQAIFVVGLCTGVALREGRRFVPVSRTAFWAASAALLVILAWRFIPDFGAYMNNQMARLGRAGAPGNIVSHNKTLLAAPRFLHILLLAYVISCMPWVKRMAAHRWAAPVRLLGRQALPVFVASTVLGLGGQILLDVEPSNVWFPWVLPPVAIGIMLLVAQAYENGLWPGGSLVRSERQRRIEPPVTTPRKKVDRAAS